MGREIPQCLKDCKSDADCDPRDRCDQTFGGGACLPKECPMQVDFGMIKRKMPFGHQGDSETEYTMICHNEYILPHRVRNEAYRSHVVECSFNVTGNNHVKWIFKDLKLTSHPSNSNNGDIEAICESGSYYSPSHIN